MPERIPELDHFLTEAKESPMLPPSEVRRRGNRRRTMRHSAIGAGALALTIVAGFGLAQTPLFDGRGPGPDTVPLPADPSPGTSDAPTPSPSESPEPTAPAAPGPTWANVPVTADVFHPEVEGEVRGEQEGVPDVALSFCDPGSYGDPHTILVRDYGAVGFEDSISAVVFGYASPDDAAAGFRMLQDAGLDCAEVYAENSYTNTGVHDASDDLPFDPPADLPAQASYVTAVGNSPATPDTGLWTEMLAIQAGPRVLYVTQQFEGMDNNCVVAPNPDVEQCVLAANTADMLERLIG